MVLNLVRGSVYKNQCYDGSDFQLESQVRDVIFEYCIFLKIESDETEFINCSFINCQFFSCNFINCSCFNCTFTASEFNSCFLYFYFKHSVLTNIILHNNDLVGCIFENSVVEDIDFGGNKLLNTTFKKSTLSYIRPWKEDCIVVLEKCNLNHSKGLEFMMEDSFFSKLKKLIYKG
jgi:uncharacterized protein YjbI with pentapeptide repeats